jgi:hypothetical protein
LEVGKQERALSGSKGASICLATLLLSQCNKRIIIRASGVHGACEGNRAHDLESLGLSPNQPVFAAALSFPIGQLSFVWLV